MATITKVSTSREAKWKAIIRRGGRSKSKTFIGKANAKAWAKEMERGHELARALDSPGMCITLAELCEEYMAQYKGKDHTRTQRVGLWEKAAGNKRLTDVTPSLIKKYLAAYQAGSALSYGGVGPDCKTHTRKLPKSRSVASRNRMLAALGAVLTFALDREYIAPPLATASVPAIPENNKRERWLKDGERERLLAACKASEWDRLYLLVLMALTTGCRLSEILTLKWSDLDLGNKRFHLKITKNGDPRSVPLIDSAICELKKHSGTGDTLLFPGVRKKYRPFGFRRYWEKAKKTAGVKDFNFNDTRHEVGSKLARQGRSLIEIGAVLGHRSVQTTKRYAHLSDEHKRTVMEDAFGGDLTQRSNDLTTKLDK